MPKSNSAHKKQLLKKKKKEKQAEERRALFHDTEILIRCVQQSQASLSSPGLHQALNLADGRESAEFPIRILEMLRSNAEASETLSCREYMAEYVINKTEPGHALVLELETLLPKRNLPDEVNLLTYLDLLIENKASNEVSLFTYLETSWSRIGNRPVSSLPNSKMLLKFFDKEPLARVNVKFTAKEQEAINLSANSEYDMDRGLLYRYLGDSDRIKRCVSTFTQQHPICALLFPTCTSDRKVPLNAWFPAVVEHTDCLTVWFDYCASAALCIWALFSAMYEEKFAELKKLSHDKLLKRFKSSAIFNQFSQLVNVVLDNGDTVLLHYIKAKKYHLAECFIEQARNCGFEISPETLFACATQLPDADDAPEELLKLLTSNTNDTVRANSP